MMYFQWLIHGCRDAVKPTEEVRIEAEETVDSFRRSAETATAVEMEGGIRGRGGEVTRRHIVSRVSK